MAEAPAAAEEVEAAPVVAAPVATAPAPVAGPVREEKVELVSGDGLKAYSVVCGSFGVKANAEGLKQYLDGQGYSAKVVYNPERNMYRVIGKLRRKYSLFFFIKSGNCEVAAFFYNFVSSKTTIKTSWI